MLLVLHRVGDSVVAEPVFKVVFDQRPNGDTDIHVEVESEGEVGRDSIISFMSEAEAAETFSRAVDPSVALKMAVDVSEQLVNSDVDLKAEAANLERELDEVVLQLKKRFHVEG